MRIVFAGTGTFAEPSFEALLAAFPGQVVGLVTQPDKDTGRRSGSSRQTGKGMATIAAAHSVPVIQPESINSPEGIALLAALQPDLVVVAAYGQIFKPAVLAVPPLGFVNVHASLLPKYRGAAPVAHAILAGDTVTGVTIFRITPGLDSGAMLKQAPLLMEADETAGELEVRLAPLGATLCVDAVNELQTGTFKAIQQDNALVIKAPKLTKEMGLIDWTKSPTQVVNQIRAMQPWPTAYTYFHRPGKAPMRLMIAKAVGAPWPPESPPGTLHPPLRVSVDLGKGVDILELQPAGKKRMSAAEFVRGYPFADGSKLGPEVAS